MKSIIRYSFLLLLISFFTAACKKDGTVVVAKEADAGTLSASASTLVLSKSAASDTAISFNWSMADFGYAAAITQTMQIDLAGNDFANATTVLLDTKQVYQAFTTADFNTLVSKLNLPFGESSQIELRIKSVISDSFAASYTNTVTLAVTPYAAVSWLYVPGAYEDWEVTSADSLISSTSNGIYTGIIYFPSAGSEFKLTPEKNWDVSYGDGGSSTLSTSGGNLTSPGAGSYQITANLNDLTIAMAYLQWSIIGSATAGDWSSDTDMKYNNGDSTWSVTTTLASGELKFRKNHDWTTNYGGSGGTLASGGDNIVISASGSYLIKLDIPNNSYTITKQ
ncbi:MAG: SusE domain-containing protein [Niabella sp.]